jgi:hypothetical protein
LKAGGVAPGYGKVAVEILHAAKGAAFRMTTKARENMERKVKSLTVKS